MSEHRGSTDAVTKVKLTSAIQRAAWLTKSAGIGEKASFEVVTHLVGDGADVKADLRAKSGKNLGSVSGKIGVNSFEGSFVIPQGTTEDVYFEADLPKHGLKARSGLLKVVPARAITNARWDPPESRQGETVKLLADTNKIPDGTEVTLEILERDADGVVDKVATLTANVKANKVEAQWEFGYYDDTAQIPTKEESQKGYYAPKFLFRATVGSVTAESGLLGFKDWIEVKLTDKGGKPVPDAEYVLKFADGTERRGKTGPSGTAREEDLPPGPVSIEWL